jgi:hypothetical protein
LSGYIARSADGVANPVPIAPVPQCRAGITQSSVYPPDDTLICDPSGTQSQQLMTAVVIQNYGVNSYMPRQPFDFAGRTGKIVFDVDAVSQFIGGFVEIELTDDPSPATTFREVQNYEVGPAPRNALSIRFAEVCGSTTAAPHNVMVYNNYVGTVITPTLENVCVQTNRGSLNHFEFQISQTHVDVYGSDFSSSTTTLLYSADFNLPFTRGYVHFNARNHATVKYGFGPDAVFHWDNIGFDGPVLATPRAYEIPDNTTMTNNDLLDIQFNGGPARNLGYLLLDETTGKPAGIYDPVNKIDALTFQNVNIPGATSATLTMNAFFNAAGHPADTSWGVSYRFNGGAWRTRNLTAGDLSSINAIAGAPWGELSMLINVPVTDLVQGTNTMELLPLNAPMDYPPVVTNIDLLVQ